MPRFVRPLRLLVLLVPACISVALGAEATSGRTTIPDAAQPQLAVNNAGGVWLVYGRSTVPLAGGAPVKPPAGPAHAQHKSGHGAASAPARAGDLFVARSQDGGASFGPSVNVAHVPGLALGLRRGPRLAVHGNRLTVTAIGTELVAFTSEDGGATWSGPAVINDIPGSAREGLHDLAGAPDGEVFVTWLDLREGKMQLWGARSRDGGRTWDRNERVYRSPDVSICECCHPSAVYGAEGTLAVMWRNAIAGARDMWMTTRARGAADFTPARKLGQGTWTLPACPMDGGRLWPESDGTFTTAWQRNGEIFLARADGSPEVRLGRGKQPLGVTRNGKATVLWQQGEDLVAADTAVTTPTPVATSARFAVVVPVGRHLVLAYEQGPAKAKQPGIVVERYLNGSEE